MSNIEKLHDELLCYIYTFLDTRTIFFNIPMVCRKWKYLLQKSHLPVNISIIMFEEKILRYVNLFNRINHIYCLNY